MMVLGWRQIFAALLLAGVFLGWALWPNPVFLTVLILVTSATIWWGECLDFKWRVLVLALVFIVVAGWFLARLNMAQEPGLDETSTAEHFGHIMLLAQSRSLTIALAGSFFACLLGLGLGLVLGLTTGRLRQFVDPLLQTFMAIPIMLYFLVSLVIFEPGPMTLVFVFAATLWLEPARMVQARLRQLRAAPFVHVARMQGRSGWTILCREWLPNIATVIWISFLLVFLNAVLLESILGYLGLGLQPGTPSLGRLIEQGAKYWPEHPAKLLAPMVLEVTWIVALRGLLRETDRRDRPLRVA